MNSKLQKKILKNTEKYSVLKLAKGIDLGQFMFYSANYSMKSYYKDISDWIYTGDERVFFKSGECMTYAQTQLHRVVNELLYDELANQIGLAVAKYEPASYKDVTSLISHDVTADIDYELYSICGMLDLPYSYDNSLEEIANKLDTLPFRFDKNQFLENLYKMMVLDSIVFQEDRHDENIHMLVNIDMRYIKPSPIIDSEYAFGCKTLDNFLQMQNKFTKKQFFVDEKEFLNQYAKNMRFVVKNATRKMHGAQKYKKDVKDLVDFASKNPNCKQFLIFALKNLDLDKAITNVEKMGYTISDDYKAYLHNLVDLSKGIFAECIKEYKSTSTKDGIGTTK